MGERREVVRPPPRLPRADGRFAPSPTGPLHVGNLRTALLAWLFARSAGARFLVRVEDLDSSRVREGMEKAQLADMWALGLDWDGPVVRQSERLALYEEAIAGLDDEGLLYPCYCTRAEIRASVSAPHGIPAADRYSGTCRELTARERAEKEASGRPPALRVRTENIRVSFEDRLLGSYEGEVDDFVVRRNDGAPAYQLAVVVDDAMQDIDEVVRGADLLDSTPRQICLHRVLGLPSPGYAHVPLVLGPDGRRLAKRHGGVALADREALGESPREVLAWMARSLGLAAAGESPAPADLLARFDPARLPLDPTVWSPAERAPRVGKRCRLRNPRGREPEMSVVHRFEGLEEAVREGFGEKIVALRRDIHREPELGFDTEKTAEKVLAALDGLPLDIQTGVAENGIVATLKGERDGPTVGLRADMDALPIHEETGLPFASQTAGKMHACGHDGHTSMLVGAAHTLSGMRERLSGNVRFFFQPAEEGGGGGKVMVEEGVADDASSIFALHLWPGLPFGTAATKAGPIMAAADAFEMTVRGAGGHGAMPHLTADAIAMAAHIVTALQTLISREVDPVEPAVLTIGEIGAGSAFNIIPGTARLGGTVRTLNEDLRRTMPERIEHLGRGVAQGMRGDADLDYVFSYPVTVNDEDAARRALGVARDLLGEENTLELPNPSMGAEDFAYFLQKIPGAFIWLGVGEDVSGLHTPTFAFDEEILPLGSALLTALAFEALS